MDQASVIGQQLMDILVPAVVALLGGLISLMLARANQWLRSRVHSASFQCATDRLTALTQNAVAEAEQTVVKTLKEDHEKWSDPETQRAVRDGVADVVKRHLGPRGMKEMQGCLGIGAKEIEGMIHTHIEAVISRDAAA